MVFEKLWIPKKETEKLMNKEIHDFYNNEEELDYDFENKEEEINGIESNSNSLCNTQDLLEKENISLEEIYDWYKNSILRRNRLPLEKERFMGHFSGGSFDTTFTFGNIDNGYVLGYSKYGVFIPTHFAPKTMRGGYNIMKDLGNNKQVPSVIAVTEDLKETLAKISSWTAVDMKFLASFREDTVEKQILYNSHPDTKNLMIGLVSEYLRESENHI